MTITANGHTLAPFTIQQLGPVSALPQPRPRQRGRADGDTVIRVLAAVVVLAVAAFAAIVSYAHIFELGRLHGQDGTAARLLPLSVDGLIAAASLVMLHAARREQPVPGLARWMLALGVAATVAANIEYGLPFGWLSAVVSAWPAVAFVGSVEMAVRFVRDARRDDTGDTAPAAVTPAAAPAVTPPRDKPPRKPKPAGGGKPPSKIEMARAALALNPALSNADLMEVAGCDRRTAQRARNDTRSTT